METGLHIYSAQLLGIAFLIAFALLAALVVFMLWIIRDILQSFEEDSAACGTYGICQGRADCNHKRCPSHPHREPRQEQAAR